MATQTPTVTTIDGLIRYDGAKFTVFDKTFRKKSRVIVFRLCLSNRTALCPAEPRTAAALSFFGFDFEETISWDSEEIRKITPSIIPPDGRVCDYPNTNGEVYVREENVLRNL